MDHVVQKDRVIKLQDFCRGSVEIMESVMPLVVKRHNNER